MTSTQLMVGDAGSSTRATSSRTTGVSASVRKNHAQPPVPLTIWNDTTARTPAIVQRHSRSRVGRKRQITYITTPSTMAPASTSHGPAVRTNAPMTVPTNSTTAQ